MGVEQVPGDVGGAGGQEGRLIAPAPGGAVGRGHEGRQAQAAQHALIDQVEGGGRPVRAGRRVARAGAQVQAHSQVPGAQRQVPHQGRGARGRQVRGRCVVGRREIGIRGAPVIAPGAGAGRVSASRVNAGRASAGRASDSAGRGGGAHEQLAAHAQVRDQRRAVVERQPQELAAPHRRHERPALQAPDEGPGSPGLPAQRPGVEDLHPLDAPPQDVTGQPGPHRLDLRQLRHGAPRSAAAGSRLRVRVGAGSV